MRIRSALTAGLAAAALVLTGCGSTVAGVAAPAAGVSVPTGASPVPQITTPDEQSAPAPTSTEPLAPAPTSAEPSTGQAPPPGDDELSVAEFAAFLEAGNQEVDSSRGTMVQESAAGDLNATFEMSGINSGSPSMNMTMTQEVSGQQVELSILLVDGVSYLGGADMLAALGVTDTTGTWLQLDSSSSNPLIAQMADQMGEVTASAGVGQAESLVAVAKSVTEIGPGEAEGYTVTEYEVLVDGAAVAQQFGAPAGASVADVPVRLWVTADGAMVKMVMDLVIGGESASTTMTMVDHNEPIEIVAPAPEELVQLPG